MPWNYIYMAATIGIIGFYLNAAISVGNIAGLALGYVPGIRDHVIWWGLVMGTVQNRPGSISRTCFMRQDSYLYRALSGNS